MINYLHPETAIITAGTSNIASYILLGVLLFMSAFASGSESAFFSIGPNEKEQLKNEDSKSSQLVLKLLEKPKDLLAILLILLNFVNIGIVILSANILDQYFQDETVKLLVDIFGITFMILLVGEVVPKIYSTKNALRISKLVAHPVNLFMKIPPMSWLMIFMVKGTKIIQKRARKKSLSITSDELEQAIALTKEENVSEGEQKILEGIVRFGNTEARQIMRSRMEMTVLNADADFSSTLNAILESGYSRVPVFKESKDNVTGILFIKDLLPHLSEDANFDWNSLVRKPYFVPENKKIDDLLKEFQSKKMHMAILVDEYGGASGLITLEDILEQIVGEITDEFDDDEIVYTKINDTTFLVEGRTALVDFYKVLDIDGKEFEEKRGDAETIGGFIIELEGRILMNNETITFDNIKLIVESSDKKRIKMIKVIKLDSEKEA